jgi:glucokinase
MSGGGRSGVTDGRWVVGVDLGGTNISVGVVAADGSSVRAERTIETRASAGADAVVARIVSQVLGALDEADVPRDAVLGVGIGAPGPLDRATGIVRITPNLGWSEFPLRARVAEGTGLPTALENDANCATLGEWWTGAARGARHVVGVTLGTGIGGGLILDGRLFHGASDVAGEIGHMTIEVDGRWCGCGNHGCLEAYASGSAIAARAREALADGRPSAMRDLAGGDLAALTTAHVYGAAAGGDAAARAIVAETARYLGTGIASLLNVFNPDVVVIAGGVTQAGDALLGPVREEVARRAFRAATDACRIVPATLGRGAGVIGAAAAFLAQLPGGPEQ